MPAAALPANETERLLALRSYEVLDTAHEAAFDSLVELAAQLTGAPISLVSLIDGDRQWFKASHGLEVTETPREHSFCAHAILTPGEAMVVADAASDPRFADNPYVTGAPDIRFYAGMPLVTPEGAAIGTLCVLDRQPRQMDVLQRKTLERLAETVMTTLELRRAMTRIREMALVDTLTGLMNRPALLDTLERAIHRQSRHGDKFGLIYADLDGLKQINDTRGHAAGDAVLRDAAEIMRANLRREDVAARLGGDEFAVVLIGGEPRSATVAGRLRIELEAGMMARGWPVTTSVGALTFHVPPGNVDEAIALADALMYEAKRAGKNRVVHRDYEGVATMATAESGAAE